MNNAVFYEYVDTVVNGWLIRSGALDDPGRPGDLPRGRDRLQLLRQPRAFPMRSTRGCGSTGSARVRSPTASGCSARARPTPRRWRASCMSASTATAIARSRCRRRCARRWRRWRLRSSPGRSRRAARRARGRRSSGAHACVAGEGEHERVRLQQVVEHEAEELRVARRGRAPRPASAPLAARKAAERLGLAREPDQRALAELGRLFLFHSGLRGLVNGR